MVMSDLPVSALNFDRWCRGELRRLPAVFPDFPEPRRYRRPNHLLTEIVVMTLLAVCSGADSWKDSRSGAELLFQVFADRYERASLLVTSNLPFSEWHQVFQGERMTAALLDRLTHRCHIFEMNGESYRFRESMKAKGKNSKPWASK